ncbi:hypothetical protein NQ317_001438 [Molorchus minor]|uniref:UTP--glucose-1-phosphate uridylyltransferase n=1 Tax=Molorchus minor TaxID=1323400 RepID=A0ABQ9JL85_9CUCU|nr:hypothetical protein NQ317_001438 [Molorchus minor]
MATLLERVKGHNRASSDSSQFIQATKRDALNNLQREIDKLVSSAETHQEKHVSEELDRFSKLFSRFLDETGPSIEWNRIEKLPPDAIRNYDSLEIPTTDIIHNMLNKLVVVKLNGGLGTSMGCHGPKSVITVRSNLTFLDLTVQQIEHLNKTYKVNVPLVLMNSFNTDEDTEKIIREIQKPASRDPYLSTVLINKESLMPIAKSAGVHNHPEAWYPPGHGDFYESFRNSGLLDRFLKNGRECCFISNIDNLGATVDLNILNLLLNPKDAVQHEFIMEVTDKTRADVKVPKEHVDAFKSVKTFKYFNTNNLWAKLGAIDRILTQGGLSMEIITNSKTLENGLNKLPSAAMKAFEGAIGINVPRSRFLPVKTTSDLLLVMSNLYNLKYGSLVMSSQRMFMSTPLVKLGGNHFNKVKDFLSRFPIIPDILELDHLTVSGDVTFGRGVSLKGTVIIIANHGDRIDIPSGAILENKIVSGNMRILDH